ncbi:MAG: hypothetical protein PHY55_01255 [Bacteroidales bacterium]|nr:hypothetical protein [Bacteroidales bacterium]
MDKDLLIHWLNRYNDEEDFYNKGDEERLGEKFRQNSFIEKRDLVEVLKWKFQGRLKGRQIRLERLVDEMDEDYIKDVSALAFKSKDDQLKLKLLSTIDGIGLSVATVILSFYDPQNYGIIDIHSWRGLFNEKEPNDIFTNTKKVILFFDSLRYLSKEYNLSCRDIEKAYFVADKSNNVSLRET